MIVGNVDYTYVTDNLDGVCVSTIVALETTLQFTFRDCLRV